MITLNKQNLEYILLGSTLLGSGGGGEIKAGKRFIEVILRQKRRVKLIDKKSNGYGFVLADIGAVSAIEANQELAIYHAFSRLNEYNKSVGKKNCTCVFAVETGPENTLAAVVAAAKNGIDVFDGDGAGRAVPQIQLCSYAAAGLPPSPAAIANDKSDSMLVFCNDSADMDSLLRPLTAADQFGNSASLSFFPQTIEMLAKGCVKGSISFSLYTGMLLQGLMERNKKKLAAALPAVNRKRAALLGEGRVIKVTDQVSGAFDIGSVTIKTRRDITMTIYTQNENLIAFNSANSSVMAVAPHSICYLKKDLQPITNAEIKKNDFVYLLAIEAVPELMTPSVITGFQKLLSGIGYAGKAGMINSDCSIMPLGNLLLSLSN